ncbi:MAG: hypothetical protein NT069_09355, partial [Planctomycetota bacterium]|nr:hypothetical protein [Planctomycetota bacterium]
MANAFHEFKAVLRTSTPTEPFFLPRRDEEEVPARLVFRLVLGRYFFAGFSGGHNGRSPGSTWRGFPGSNT